jgi:DNA-binding PadR family transcriptional regulator
LENNIKSKMSIADASNRNLKISKEMHERITRDFMDLIILKELQNGASMGGYEIISLFHRKFHVLIPAGLMYSTLYAMERKGLIKGVMNHKKRMYKLTKKGEKKIQCILHNHDSILSFMKFILDEKNISKLL